MGVFLQGLKTFFFAKTRYKRSLYIYIKVFYIYIKVLCLFIKCHYMHLFFIQYSIRSFNFILIFLPSVCREIQCHLVMQYMGKDVVSLYSWMNFFSFLKYFFFECVQFTAWSLGDLWEICAENEGGSAWKYE